MTNGGPNLKRKRQDPGWELIAIRRGSRGRWEAGPDLKPEPDGAERGLKLRPGLFERQCPYCGEILHREDAKDHLIWEHPEKL